MFKNKHYSEMKSHVVKKIICISDSEAVLKVRQPLFLGAMARDSILAPSV